MANGNFDGEGFCFGIGISFSKYFFGYETILKLNDYKILKLFIDAVAVIVQSGKTTRWVENVLFDIFTATRLKNMTIVSQTFRVHYFFYFLGFVYKKTDVTKPLLEAIVS